MKTRRPTNRKLVAAMRQAGLDQTQLAAKARVGVRTVHNMVTRFYGNTRPAQANAVAQALGKTPEELDLAPRPRTSTAKAKG